MAETNTPGDVKTVTSPNANGLDLDYLQGSIIEAPQAIGLLGHVMLLTVQKDFSLISKPKPENIQGESKPTVDESKVIAKVESTQSTVGIYDNRAAFRYVTHPESFRATLVQVSNAGYIAFLIAHSNMDKIRLSCGNLEKHINTITECIQEGDDDDIKDFVPVSLKSMLSAAEDCATWSTEIRGGFRAALDLLQEVISSCNVTQMTNQERVAEFKRLKDELEKDNEEAEEEQKRKKDKDKEIQRIIAEEESKVKSEAEELESEGRLIPEKDIIKEKAELNRLILQQKETQRKLDELTKQDGKLFRTLNFVTVGLAHTIRYACGSDYSERKKEGYEVKQKLDEVTHNVETKRIGVNANDELVISNTKQAEKIRNDKEKIGKKVKEQQDVQSDMDKLSENINSRLKQISRNEVEELDLDKTKKIITDAIRQLSELDKRWKVLELLFEKVANALQIAMGKTFIYFSEQTNVVLKRTALNVYAKRKLMELSHNAYTQCYAVSSVSTSYLKISDKYLMPSVTELGSLLGLDSLKDRTEIQKKTEEIRTRSEDALCFIKDVIESAKQENADKMKALTPP